MIPVCATLAPSCVNSNVVILSPGVFWPAFLIEECVRLPLMIHAKAIQGRLVSHNKGMTTARAVCHCQIDVIVTICKMNGDFDIPQSSSKIAGLQPCPRVAEYRASEVMSAVEGGQS